MPYFEDRKKGLCLYYKKMELIDLKIVKEESAYFAI